MDDRIETALTADVTAAAAAVQVMAVTEAEPDIPRCSFREPAWAIG